MSQNKDYPNCERLHQYLEEHHAMVEFLEWLTEKGILLCKQDGSAAKNGWVARSDWWPVANCEAAREELVLDFMAIDVRELDRERRTMLSMLAMDP